MLRTVSNDRLVDWEKLDLISITLPKDLDDVATSADLALKVDKTTTVNGHALTWNITLTASDVWAPSGSGSSTGTNTGDQDLSGLVPKTTTVNWHALSSNVTVTASDVGLGNVDNTSDADKPISSATQSALNAKQDTLVSGTNIKTINGSSVLGSGDLTVSGSWDVVWPLSATDSAIPLFDTTTGKLLKDSAKTIVTTLWSDDTTVPTSKAVKDVTDTKVTWPASSIDNALARFDSTTGKIIQNGVVTESDLWDIDNVNSLQFDLTPTSVTPSEWKMYWDADNWTVSLGMPGGNVNLQLGEEMLLRAKNVEGAQINNGSVVRISSAAAALPQVVLVNNTEELATRTIAVATEDVLDQQTWYFTTEWMVRGINTASLTEWATVYLGSTDWSLTTTLPTWSANVIRIGTCIRQHATEGVLYVNIQSKELYRDREITKEPTGFTNNENITCTYNSTTRKVTLTGTFDAYWKGKRVTVLTNGWESAAHADVVGTYFLSYNGDTDAFTFSTTAWTFDKLQIAFVSYWTTDKFAIREMHGLMSWQAHLEFHKTIGTYRDSGGTLSGYTVGSTTAAERRPLVSETVIYDEDLKTTNPALSTEIYTQHYISGAGATSVFAVDQNDIVPLSGNQPYYNQFTGGAWQQTLMSTSQYMSVWLIAMPTCAWTTCQKYRYLWMQGQSEGSLASQTALQPQDLNLGSLTSLSPEFIFIWKVIIQYIGGNWQIASVSNLTGNKFIQSASPSGIYLSTVATDATLTGSGTVWDPLTVVQNYVTLTGDQTVAGIKTFSSFPLTPSSAPTTDYQASNKKYVDDNAGKVWTKTVDEASIGDDKILVYKTASGKLEYEAKPTGGSGEPPKVSANIAGTLVTWLIKKVRVENWFTIANVTATVGVLCTGSSIKIDVRRNGTATTNSIFTSDTPLEILTSTTATNWEFTVEDAVIDNWVCATGDILYIYVTQIGSTVAGADLFVGIY